MAAFLMSSVLLLVQLGVPVVVQATLIPKKVTKKMPTADIMANGDCLVDCGNKDGDKGGITVEKEIIKKVEQEVVVKDAVMLGAKGGFVKEDVVKQAVTAQSADKPEVVQEVVKEEAVEKCVCTVDESNSCGCSKSCTKRQELSICADLLGPCTCTSTGSMCDCQGYCPAMGDMRHACTKAPCCSWDGHFCAAMKKKEVIAPVITKESAITPENVSDKMSPMEIARELLDGHDPIKVFAGVASVSVALAVLIKM